MDYFSELTESYRRLKKRTFKLRYISEGNASPEAYALGAEALNNPDAVSDAKASLEKAGASMEKKAEVTAGVTLWTNLDGGKTANFSAGGNPKMWTIIDGQGGETEEWPLYVQKFAEPADSEAVGQAGSDEEGNVPEGELTDVQKKEMEIKQQEEAAAAAEQAKFESIGPTWEETTGTPIDPIVRDNLLKSEKDAREFCENETEESFMCKGNNLMRYIGGASNWGLEWKLANGRGVQTETETDKEGNEREKATIGDELPDTTLNTALIQEATESMALLTAFLGNDGGDCEAVKNRISKYRSGGQNGLILYGGEVNDDGNPSQGIFISPINALQLTAIKKMEEKSNCGEGALRNVTGAMYTQKAKNAVKGTFYELTIQAAVEINAADRMPNGTTSEKFARKQAIKLALGTMAQKLDDKMGELREISQEDGPDEIARDLEAQFDHEVIKEQAAMMDAFVGRCSIQGDQAAQLSMQSGGLDIENDEFACADAGGTWEKDDETLKNWVLDEIMAVRRAIQIIDADGTLATGQTENRTGGREDTKFIYNQDKDGLTPEERARKAGDLMGATPVEITSGPDKGAWILGAGQKRIAKMGKIKIGELNNEGRRETIYKGEELAKNAVEAGFYKKIRDMQFASSPTGVATIGSAREKAAEDYGYSTDPANPGIETRLKSATAGLESDTTYKSAGGRIKAQSASVLLGNIKSQIGDLLSLDQLKDSIVGKALMKGGGKRGDAKGRDSDWRDFKDPSTRKRAREAIERTARYAILSKDLKDPNKQQAAQDYIVRNALMTGANARNMGQLITDDEGDTLTIAHNQGLQAVCDAQRNGKVDFNIKPGGTGVTMTINDPGSEWHGMEVKWSQQGTWAGPKDDPERHTRSQTDYPYDTVKMLARKNGVRGETVKRRRASRNDIRAQQAAAPIAANTFHDYMKGQLQLLETILSQTK